MDARTHAHTGGWLSAFVLTAVACSSDVTPRLLEQQAAGAGAGGSSAGTSAGGAPVSAGSSGGGGVSMTMAGGASAGVAGATAGEPSAGGGGGGAGGGAGASTSGGFRKTITLDTSASGANVTMDVDKYPLAIQLDATNFDFTQAQPMGTDVHFEKMDGGALPHSIEHWDASAKTAALWVKLDKVVANTSGQALRMVWGGPGAAPSADSKAVFSTADGFYGVWHLDEDGNTTAGGYKDASGHEAHGTGVNMIAGSRVGARIGKGADLANAMGQNTARWIRVEGEKATAYNPNQPMTVSVWALAHSYPIQSYETIMSKGDTSWSLQRVQYEQTGYQSCLLAGSGTTYHFCIYDFAKQPRVTEQWLHFMLVLDEPNMTLYINGNLNSQGSGNPWNKGTHPLGIGNQTQLLGARRQWDGTIDEARVMHAARSAGWAKLDFETQKAMQKAVTYGAVEPRP
jgi:hypothetical protein